MGNSSSLDEETPAGMENEADTTSNTSTGADIRSESEDPAREDLNTSSDNTTAFMAADPARESPKNGENLVAQPSASAGAGTSQETGPSRSENGEVELVGDHSEALCSCSVLSHSDSDMESEESSTPFSFELVLHCESAAVSKAEVKFVSRPKTVGDVKRVIQDEFKAPVCCQKLFLGSTLLRDKERLKFYRIRNGDTLYLHYNSEADVEDIYNVLTHMEKMVNFIDSIQPTLSSPKQVCSNFQHTLIENVKPEKVESLAVKYFYPCSTERAKANRLLFIQSGGLDLLYKLHEALLKQPWCRTPLVMQYLEHALLRVLWNFTAAFTVRMLVLSKPTLCLLFKSFNRVNIPHKTYIHAPLNNPFVPAAVTAFEQDRISSEVVYKALGTICNLAELPECRLEIASNQQFLKQVIATMVTVAYKYIARQVALAGLLCLAYSPETHVHLCQPCVLKGILEACVKCKSWYPETEDTTRLENLLLRYFGVMFFGQLVSSSSDRLSPTEKLLMRAFIQSFLSEANHQEIREHEVKSGYIWSTLVPFAKLAFIPSHNQYSRRTTINDKTKTTCFSETGNESEDPTLEMLCVEAGVFSLQNVLSGNEGRDILISEGLLDYVVCLPWNIPEGSRAHERAVELVSYLSTQMQLQPPSLVTMVKAKLAVMHLGLVKVIETNSVHELLAEVYQ